jgi:hypothetical protein
MKLEEIKQLVTNKLATLQDKKNLAYMGGDMDEFYRVETEIEEVEKILEKLNS